MMNEPQIQFQGNLTADPEMRYTPTGVAVASFSVACNPRSRNNATGEWEDGETIFLRCIAWRYLGENLAESLRRGDPVTVIGRLRQRNWETREGEKRTAYEVQADSVSVPMDKRTVRLTKTNRETPASESPQTAPEATDSGAGTDTPADATGQTPATEGPGKGRKTRGGVHAAK